MQLPFVCTFRVIIPNHLVAHQAQQACMGVGYISKILQGDAHMYQQQGFEPPILGCADREYTLYTRAPQIFKPECIFETILYSSKIVTLYKFTVRVVFFSFKNL